MQLPSGKKTKTGYSTNADILNKLAIDYPFVQKILDYRTYTKLKSTYAEGLLNSVLEDGRIHSHFLQTVTATGRISSAEPNLQNIPVKTEIGRELRKVFIPKPGFCFADADYSQIELRVLAHLSKDSFLTEAFNNNEDIHSVTASAVFNVSKDEITPLMRRTAKVVNFGIIYGMSENAAVSITKYGDSVEHITKTIGKPLDGVEVEIRDLSTGKKLEDGASGEICIRSEDMIVCYYKLDISKQPVDDEGWLATGDLGCFDKDGYLKIVGRVKELIIRGGENISPNEVAGAIAAIPEIADVKVLGVPSEFYGEEVAAAIVLKDGKVFDEEKVREYLATRLAKFKIPKYFVCFDAFPLLGSGKVDVITLKKSIIEKIKDTE